jgi:ABC-2 type transport system permease protein
MQKYRASFLMGLQSSLEYRFEFLVGIISTLFPILIQVFLWSAIYGGSGEPTMYGYDFAQMLAYVAIAGAVGKFVVTGVEEMVNNDIHTGGLSAFIVKPVKYIPFRFFQAMGQKFASTVTMLAFTAVSVTALVLTVGFEIRLYAVLLFIPALIFAMLVNFFIFFIVSISAFWLTEVGRFFHALQIAVMVASGGVFPITVFGDTYVSISRYLPFLYTSYFPISVMTGALKAAEILTGMCVQLLWIVVLAALSGVLWRAGLKRYVAVGG